jgi:hypothetical protein
VLDEYIRHDIVAAVVYGGLTLPRPWVPAEQITLKNGPAQTGYVLGADNDRLTVLWARSRKVELVDVSDVLARAICEETGRVSTLPQLLEPHTVKATNYPRCDK